MSEKRRKVSREEVVGQVDILPWISKVEELIKRKELANYVKCQSGHNDYEMLEGWVEVGKAGGGEGMRTPAIMSPLKTFN